MAGIYINIEDSGGYLGMHQAKIQAMHSYNQALCKEVAHYAASHGSNETIESIYVSAPLHLIPPDIFASLVETVFVEFDTSNIQEITADLEPHSVTPERLGLLESLGVTRINLLARSFLTKTSRTLNAPTDRVTCTLPLNTSRPRVSRV